MSFILSLTPTSPITRRKGHQHRMGMQNTTGRQEQTAIALAAPNAVATTANPEHSHQDPDHSRSPGSGPSKLKIQWLTKERRLYGVIFIAFCFLVAELIIGFTNNALVLVADAFHITSDLIGCMHSPGSNRQAQGRSSARGIQLWLATCRTSRCRLQWCLSIGLGRLCGPPVC